MSFQRTVHKILAPLIYRRGTALVPSAVAVEWPQRHFLKHLLQRQKVDCVIDVGANEGQYAQELRLIGYKGLILSFEPTPESFRKLSEAAAADTRWHVFRAALGSEPGERSFNLMSVSVLNSFREPTVRETDYAAYYNNVVDRLKVRVQRLDCILEELQHTYGFRRPFLKTDTQGFDLEVFRGATGIRHLLAGIQGEIPIKRLYENVPSWNESIEEYTSAGFDLAGLFAVNPRERPIIECDCYFVPAKQHRQ